VTALDTEVAGTGKGLGTVLGLPGYEVTVGAVTGVTALNLKQVKVTFNKPVDEATAETAGAYKVYNANGTTDLVGSGSVELQSDKTSVIISLQGQLNNGQSAAKIVVEGVKDAEGNTIPKFEGTFSVLDNIVPTVVAVKSVGPREISVEFSEPVTGFVAGDFSVDNGGYFVTDATADGLTKVTVETGLELTEGDHTLTVNSSNGADYAGFKPVPVTITFTHVRDTTAPTASVKSVSPTSVTIQFNKPVDNVTTSNVLFRHTYNNSTYQVAGDVGVTGSGSEYTIDFSAIPIALGANNLYIAYLDAANGPFITDKWGNKFEATSLPITVTMDQTKPTVTEVKVVDAQTMQIVFSETVDSTSATNVANYTVKDSTGTKIDVLSASLGGDGKTVTLTFNPDALGGGTYTVEISGVTDVALIKNPMEPYSATINVNDTVKPYVLDSKWTVVNSTDLKLYIAFSEQMAVSTLTKANFSKKVGANWVALGSNDTVTPAADGKSVTIVLSGYPQPANTTDEVIRVGYVTDVAGNGLRSILAIGQNNPGLDNKTTTQFSLVQDSIAVDTAEAISTKRIKVTFDGRLSAVGAEDFFVAYTATTNSFDDVKVVSHTINSDGKSEVVFELKTKQMTTDAKDPLTSTQLDVAVKSNTTKTFSFLGTAISPSTNELVADKIAPVIVTAKLNNSNTIELTFSEALLGTTFATAPNAKNGFSVSSGTLTNATFVSPNKVLLNGSNFVVGSTVTYNDVAGITDSQGNALASFSKLVSP